VALKSSKQLEEERRKASRVPARLGASGNSGLQSPKASPGRKRGMTIGLVAAGAMTIFGFSSIDRQPQQPCEPNPNGDQTCPQGSGSSSSGSGSRSFFSSWGSSSGYSSGSYWGGHSSGTSGSSISTVSRGGFGSTGGSHASSGS
jgi:hypothetical protein